VSSHLSVSTSVFGTVLFSLFGTPFHGTVKRFAQTAQFESGSGLADRKLLAGSLDDIHRQVLRADRDLMGTHFATSREVWCCVIVVG
jgi:hypothetical protein